MCGLLFQCLFGSERDVIPAAPVVGGDNLNQYRRAGVRTIRLIPDLSCRQIRKCYSSSDRNVGLAWSQRPPTITRDATPTENMRVARIPDSAPRPRKLS